MTKKEERKNQETVTPGFNPVRKKEERKTPRGLQIPNPVRKKEERKNGPGATGSRESDNKEERTDCRQSLRVGKPGENKKEGTAETRPEEERKEKNKK